VSARAAPGGYHQLLTDPVFLRLAGGTLLARLGNDTFLVALVLFVLQHFRSPALAGLAALCAIAPGLLVSPVAGALLDRHGRMRLILLDFAVSATTLGLLATLATYDRLPPWALLVVVALNSLTTPLTRSGARSLIPLVVPRERWDRANAIDGAGLALSGVLAPLLAGAMVATIQGEGALIVAALAFCAAAAVLSGLAEPAVEVATTGSLVRDAWVGLRYVATNPSLRALAVAVCAFNVGNGAVAVALPVLVLQRFGQGAPAVGAFLAVESAAALVGGLLCGRIDSAGRERRLLAAGMAASAMALLVLAVAPAPTAVLAGVVVSGLATGPISIGLSALRQRRTHRAWLSRAFAVSLSLNYLGFPLGSGVAGLLAGLPAGRAGGPGGAMAVGALAAAVAAAVTVLAVPRAAPPETD
jgi:MFS family permease